MAGDGACMAVAVREPGFPLLPTCRSNWTQAQFLNPTQEQGTQDRTGLTIKV